jgi:hypothetical protein
VHGAVPLREFERRLTAAARRDPIWRDKRLDSRSAAPHRFEYSDLSAGVNRSSWRLGWSLATTVRSRPRACTHRPYERSDSPSGDFIGAAGTGVVGKLVLNGKRIEGVFAAEQERDVRFRQRRRSARSLDSCRSRTGTGGEQVLPLVLCWPPAQAPPR